VNAACECCREVSRMIGHSLAPEGRIEKALEDLTEIAAEKR
jgi:hypothetical protein